MAPEDIVIDFVGRVIECGMALREHFGGASREDPRLPLSLSVPGGGSRVREGSLEGVGDFRIHGAGCRFELASGEIVDFDWDVDGREVFDAWRLMSYARSRGFESGTEDSLSEAARRMAGLTEVRPGWFALAFVAGREAE